MNGADVTAQVVEDKYSFHMPAGDVSVTVSFKAIVYSITVSGSKNGAVSADKENAIIGEEVTLTVTPDIGYVLSSLTVNGEDVTAQVADGAYSFTMPEEDVILSATVKETTVEKVSAISVTRNQALADGEPVSVGETLYCQNNVIAGHLVWLADGAEISCISYVTVPECDTLKLGIFDADDYFAQDYSEPLYAYTFPVNGALPKYTLTIEESAGGTVTAHSQSFYEGDSVTLNITPDDGYKLESLSYTEEGSATVSVLGNTFYMPASDVTVRAAFAAQEPVETVLTVTRDGVELSAGYIACPGDKLVASWSGDGEVTIQWKDQDGSILATGNTFDVPEELDIPDNNIYVAVYDADDAGMLTFFLLRYLDEGDQTGRRIGMMIRAADGAGNAIDGYFHARLNGGDMSNATEWFYYQMEAGEYSMVFDSGPTATRFPRM